MGLGGMTSFVVYRLPIHCAYCLLVLLRTILCERVAVYLHDQYLISLRGLVVADNSTLSYFWCQSLTIPQTSTSVTVFLGCKYIYLTLTALSVSFVTLVCSNKKQIKNINRIRHDGRTSNYSGNSITIVTSSSATKYFYDY